MADNEEDFANKRAHTRPNVMPPIIIMPDVVVDENWQPIENRNRQESDPYNNMEGHQTRPDNIKQAQENLGKAEHNATANPISTINGGADQAKSAEQNQSYNPRFTGKGLPGAKKDKGKDKGKGKGFLKKKGPLITIMTLLIGGGGMMAGVQSLMPFSLIAQFQEAFDTIKTISELRTDIFTKLQLSPDTRYIKDPIRASMFGKLKFEIKGRQAIKLAKQGIEVDKNFTYTDKNGKTKTATVFKFDDGSGFEPIIIAPSDALAAEISANNLNAGVMSHNQAFAEQSDYRNGYIKSSRTWRGSVKAWFDKLVVKFLESNSLTRNRFKNFQERVKAEAAGNTKQVAVEMMQAGADSQVEVGVRNTEGGEEKGPDGKVIAAAPAALEGADEITGIKAKLDASIYKGNKKAIEAKLKTAGNEMADTVSGIAGATVNIACTLFNFIGAINLMLVAHEGIQIFKLVSGYFEAIQKVQAGDGADSPINDLSNGLTTPADSTYETEDGGTVTLTGSAMESVGIKSIYGNRRINQKDHSVSSFNIGARLEGIIGYLGSNMTSFLGCAIAKAAASLADGALTLAKIIICAGTYGMGCVAFAIEKAASSVSHKIGVSVAIEEIAKRLAPMLFKAFARDIITALAGEDLGNALVSGANMYMGSNHRAGGGALTNMKGLSLFMEAHQEVIANEARYQRETRSPFDITSKYTFIGSLASSMISFSAQASSFSGILTGIGNTVTSSIVTLLPSASAIATTEAIMAAENNDCPYLKSIDAVGDAFCNPYIISDLSTIEADPADIVQIVDEKYKGLLDEKDGTVMINPDSNLAKYVIFCGQRGSPFGVADQNIVGAITNWSPTSMDVANTAVNTAVGAIPVIGDAVNIIGNAVAIDNHGWISGESCVQGNTVASVKSPNWEEAKYYQRLLEDQRLSEAMGLVETSAVTAFLDEYYKANPLDNSYEGLLARKSGLTKETVIATLEQLEYYSFLANYDPTELYPLPDYSAYYTLSLADQVPSGIIADHDAPPTSYYILYTDTRTRNYAI